MQLLLFQVKLHMMNQPPYKDGKRPDHLTQGEDIVMFTMYYALIIFSTSDNEQPPLAISVSGGPFKFILAGKTQGCHFRRGAPAIWTGRSLFVVSQPVNLWAES